MAMEYDKDLDNYVYSAFRHGLINIWLLKIIGKHETYPYALVKACSKSRSKILKRFGKSDVYNALNALEKRGLVRSAARLRGARLRKEYRLTAKGRRLLYTVDKVRKQIMDEFNE